VSVRLEPAGRDAAGPAGHGRGSTTTVIAAAALDVASILVFVAIGRRSHDESGSVVAGIAKVAAPFLVALAAGWMIARAWRSPTTLATAAVIWLTTVTVGMVLRHTVFDRGTATSFVVVTAVVTGVLLFGWRAVANAVRRRSPGHDG
jgi:Protein of unknown function (DUF3054)